MEALVRAARALLAAGVLVGPTPAFARQGEAAGREEPPAASRPAEGSARVPRARLERRLQEARRVVERLEQAIERLDAGERPGEVLRDLEPGGNVRPPRDDAPAGALRGERAPAPVTPEQLRELMAFSREHVPGLARRLAAARESDPGAAERVLTRLAPRLMELRRLRDQEPDLFEIRRRELLAGLALAEAQRKLAEHVRAGAPEEQVNAARADLRAALAEVFDARAAAEVRELHQLRERLAALEAAINARRADRDRALDAQVEEAERSIRAGTPPEARPRRPRPE